MFSACRRLRLGLHLLEDGADAGVSVLDVVDRVVIVGLDGLVRSKSMPLPASLHIEQGSVRCRWDFFQQVGQGDGVAGTLGHPDRLTARIRLTICISDVQILAVEADGVHGTLHAGDVAVVVSAPDVDGLGEAANLASLLPMVGDVGGKVGGDATVGTDGDFVLGLLLGAVVSLLLVDGAVLGGTVRCGTLMAPSSAFANGHPAPAACPHGQHSAGLVEGALMEPDIVVDAVLCQVAWGRRCSWAGRRQRGRPSELRKPRSRRGSPRPCLCRRQRICRRSAQRTHRPAP